MLLFLYRLPSNSHEFKIFTPFIAFLAIFRWNLVDAVATVRKHSVQIFLPQISHLFSEFGRFAKVSAI